jgi:hypothetical protein
MDHEDPFHKADLRSRKTNPLTPVQGLEHFRRYLYILRAYGLNRLRFPPEEFISKGDYFHIRIISEYPVLDKEEEKTVLD